MSTESTEVKSLVSKTEVESRHLAEGHVMDNSKDDDVVRKESEEERLNRIAEMFLAKPGLRGDRRENDKEIELKEKKMSDRLTKKTMKKNKKKIKVQKKQKTSKDITKKYECKALKQFEASLDHDAADVNEKSGKLVGCFAFIMEWFEKRKVEKQLIKKRVNFTDIMIALPVSPRVADDQAGSGLNKDAFEIEDVKPIPY